MFFSSSIHTDASESLGARQSPRGDSDPPEPTLGPFGMHERLNWLVLKKRYRKIPRFFLISASVYSLRATCGPSGQLPVSRSPQADSARKATLVGVSPKRRV